MALERSKMLLDMLMEELNKELKRHRTNPHKNLEANQILLDLQNLAQEFEKYTEKGVDKVLIGLRQIKDRTNLLAQDD